MPQLTRPRYLVAFQPPAGDVETHEVTIHHQDQLRAELELGRRGVDLRANPLHLSTAFVWAAMKRDPELPDPGNLDTFLNHGCVGLDDGGEEEVGPTPPAEPSAHGSALPSTGPASTGTPPPTS